MASESVVHAADFGLAQLSCDITNCRAILEIAISAMESGDGVDRANAGSALYGLLALMRKAEGDVENIERTVSLTQGAQIVGQAVQP